MFIQAYIFLFLFTLLPFFILGAFMLLVGHLLFWLFRKTFATRRLKMHILLWLAVSIIFALFATIALGGLRGNQGSRDGRRVADMRTMRSVLKMFYEKKGYYPEVSEGVPSKRWQQLRQELENELGLLLLPKDPLSRGIYFYDYQNSPDRQNYVLKAVLQYNNLYYLSPEQGDVDGVVYGLQCGNSQEPSAEFEFCLQK